jgi:hypothetical protein
MSGRLLTDERGQTLQDFALGIGIFLVAFVFVLLLFPDLLTPFQSDASGSERAQARQVSNELLDNYSTPGERNNLSARDLQPLFGPDVSNAALRERFGLDVTASVNITIRTLDGERTVFATANRPYNREVATSTRIVTLADSRCDPACRLVVRVW